MCIRRGDTYLWCSFYLFCLCTEGKRGRYYKKYTSSLELVLLNFIKPLFPPPPPFLHRPPLPLSFLSPRPPSCSLHCSPLRSGIFNLIFVSWTRHIRLFVLSYLGRRKEREKEKEREREKERKRERGRDGKKEERRLWNFPIKAAKLNQKGKKWRRKRNSFIPTDLLSTYHIFTCSQLTFGMIFTNGIWGKYESLAGSLIRLGQLWLVRDTQMKLI